MAWQVFAGIAAASALAQWLNSESARKATREERKRIEDLYNRIQQPDFKPEDIRPEDFEVVGQYVPQVADFIAEQAPEIIGVSPDMERGRAAQLDALEQLRGVARAERDPALMAMLEQASQQAQAEAQSRQQSALMGAARRGQLDSTGALVAQLQGGESAMDRMAEHGRQAAIEAYRNRQAAMRGAADLGGQIFQQDVGLRGRNVDIINQFNQRATQRAQQYGQYRADTANEAMRQNLREKQRIADANRAQQNKYLGEVQDLRQRQFQNELDVAAGKAGQARGRIEDIRSTAGDYSNMIQGTSDIGMAGYDAYLDEQRRKEEQERLKRG